MENSQLRRSYRILEEQFHNYPDIVEMVKDYMEIYSMADFMIDGGTPFQITATAHNGVTLSYGSILFRMLTEFKGQFVINFPNWRGWEMVVPIGTKNHWTIKRLYRSNGYEHSFRFKTSKELCDFFEKYIASEKGIACIYK